MTSPPASLSTEALQAQLESSTTAASRLLFLLVAISLTVSYICADGLGWLKPFERGSASVDVRTRLEADIRNLEPLLALSDRLRANRGVVRSYRDFVRPFFALDNAATNAIRGATVNSAAYRSIDPVDLERARDTTPGLTQLSIDLDFYSSDDLRTSGLGEFEHFVGAFVAPERTLDNVVVLEQLQADARVAKALGQTVRTPGQWPASLHFRDFVKSEVRDPDLLRVLDRARDVPNPDSIVDRLVEISSRNDVRPISISGLRNSLQRNEFVFASDTSAVQKIQVSFLPIGVSRNLLVLCSPLALLFVVTLLGSQLERRMQAVDALRGQVEEQDLALLESQWFVSRGASRHPGHESISTHVSRILLISYAFIGQISPIVAHAIVMTFMWRLHLPLAIFVPSFLVALVCSIASLGLVLGLIRIQRSELIGATPARPRARKAPS